MKTYCIICPRGCELNAEEAEGKVLVTGNACPRGAEYGEQELCNPRRMVTSTVRLALGGVTPVKTALAVPKDKIFEVLCEIKKITLTPPVAMGDTVIKNVCGLGTDIVATKSVK